MKRATPYRRDIKNTHIDSHPTPCSLTAWSPLFLSFSLTSSLTFHPVPPQYRHHHHHPRPHHRPHRPHRCVCRGFSSCSFLTWRRDWRRRNNCPSRFRRRVRRCSCRSSRRRRSAPNWPSCGAWTTASSRKTTTSTLSTITTSESTEAKVQWFRKP